MILLLCAILLQDGDEKLKDEIAKLDEAIRGNPSDAASLRQRGRVRLEWARLKAGRDESPVELCDKAVLDLDRAGELKNDDDETWTLKGLALVLKGDHTKGGAAEALYWEAKGMFDRAWTMNASRVATFVGRAHAYLAASRHNELEERLDAALANVGVAIKLDPTGGTHYLLRAAIHREAGRNDDAAKDYEKALSLGCADYESLSHFGGTKAAEILERQLDGEKDERIVARLKRLRDRLADVEKQAKEREGEIGKLIEALGDDALEKREEARTALLKVGEAALPALQKAALGDDADLKAAATALMAAIRRKIRY